MQAETVVVAAAAAAAAPRKVALITGITGQDGSYLAELLLEKGYAVSRSVVWSLSLYFSKVGSLAHSPLPHTFPSFNCNFKPRFMGLSAS